MATNAVQGRSYVEAKETVASHVFAGLMNIMIKANPSTSTEWVQVSARISFPESQSIVRRVRIVVCELLRFVSLSCHARKASQNSPESI